MPLFVAIFPAIFRTHRFCNGQQYGFLWWDRTIKAIGLLALSTRLGMANILSVSFDHEVFFWWGFNAKAISPWQCFRDKCLAYLPFSSHHDGHMHQINRNSRYGGWSLVKQCCTPNINHAINVLRKFCALAKKPVRALTKYLNTCLKFLQLVSV